MTLFGKNSPGSQRNRRQLTARLPMVGWEAGRNLVASSARSLVLLTAVGIAAGVLATSTREVPAADDPTGVADPSEMHYPLAVAVKSAKEIFVADRKLPGIWRVAGDHRDVFFQGSKKFRTPLNAVRCVRMDREGRLLAGDSATREVYRIEAGKDPVPLTGGGIGIPMDLAVDREGLIYVSDLETHRIWRLPADGSSLEVFAAVPAPRGIALDSEDRLLVVSHGKNQVVRLTTTGEAEIVVAGRPFQFPHQVAVHPDGSLFVSDGYAKTIWRVPPKMPPVPFVAGAPLIQPVGLEIHEGDVYVADPRAQGIFRVNAEGQVTKLP